MTQGHAFKQALRKKPVTWDDLFALLDGLTEEGRLKTAIATDPDIDIGDVHMLDIANAKINPATKESVDAIAAAVQGTGLPIPLDLSDPGDDNWSAVIDPNPIARDCNRLLYRVGSSGFQLSFDSGQTVHLTRPEDTADDIAIAIPQGSDVRIRRLTAGTAIDGLIVEVR